MSGMALIFKIHTNQAIKKRVWHDTLFNTLAVYLANLPRELLETEQLVDSREIFGGNVQVNGLQVILQLLRLAGTGDQTGDSGIA